MNAEALVSFVVVTVLAAAALWRPLWGFVFWVGGMLFIDRGFAYMHVTVGGVQLFVTEAVLAAALLRFFAIWVSGRFSLKRPAPSAVNLGGGLFAAGALQSAARGLAGGKGLSAVARDAALGYYALFTPLVGAVPYDETSFRRAARVILGCVVFQAVYLFLKINLGFTHFTAMEPNTAAEGMYQSICLLLSFAFLPFWEKNRAWYLVLLLQMCFITLSLVRTVWVAFAAAYVVLLFLFYRAPWWKKLLGTSLTVILSGILLSTGIVAAGLSQLVSLEVLGREAASFFQGHKSANLDTRLWLWRDALSETFDFSAFQPGDLDERALRSSLKQLRAIDRDVLETLHRSPEGIDDLKESDFRDVFNVFLGMEGKFLHAESSPSAPPEFLKMIDLGTGSRNVDYAQMRRLNRTMLEIMYPEGVRTHRYTKKWEPPLPPPPPAAVVAPAPPAVAAPPDVPAAPSAPALSAAPAPAAPPAATAVTQTEVPAPSTAVFTPQEPPAPVQTVPVEPQSHGLTYRMVCRLSVAGKPLFGVPFGFPFRPPRLIHMLSTPRFDPHNSYVAIVFRMGLVGFVGFVLFVGGILRSSYRQAKGLEGYSFDKSVVFGLLACVVYVLAHATTDVTLENPFKGSFLWILLGALILWQKKMRRENSPGS